MIEKHFKFVYPSYSPELIIPVRNGRNSRFHEALLWEFSLGDLEQYIVDLEVIFKDIAKFLKYRGTLFSMKLAMTWVGFPAPEFIRLSRTSYEVNPGKKFNSLQISAIQSACRQSAPAAATLKRIFHNDQSVSV
ncbi:MAG TPA: hypothetical protein VE954_19660 [Oligoflexus sp.]|uniref:hypothetical protein n=1 Tax=Oligoflexus sp. TaxID=1971216 RepID=UPI002D71040F|nr:hypothetical protein [Oligoflexus sp.]HYX35319.1 hypothetical protein [Oligoflexus sp.]